VRGLGVAIVSKLTVALECEVGRLGIVPINDLRIPRALHRLSLRGKRPTPAMNEFLELLRGRYDNSPDADEPSPKSGGGKASKTRRSRVAG